MAIDPAGVTPGLSNSEPVEKTVQLKCRNPRCSGIEAVEVHLQGSPGQRLYRCLKCGHPWSLNVGGAVNL
jgi:DNA-directed RNA polymerase subunit M/transcription elongation factor TFIIS